MRRHRASGPDQLLAGPRYVILFEELDVPDAPVLTEALAAIAAAGLRTRVALDPKPGVRTWSFDSATAPTVHRLPDGMADASAAEVLEYIRRRPGGRRPLELHVAPRRIAVDADHGLGDGRFTLELVSALCAVAEGRVTPWMVHDDAALALPRAVLHTFGRHPRRALRAWRLSADWRSARARRLTSSSPVRTEAWSPSVAVVIAHVDAETEARVTAWRHAHGADVGSAAVWVYVVRGALRAAGLQMTDTVRVAFDCRRYLPKRLTVNSNFIISPDVPFSADESLPSLIKRLREYTETAVPLVGLGAVSAKAVLGRGGKPSADSARNVDALASVLYTDMGHIRSLDDLPWRGVYARSYLGILDPAGPESVTVLNSRIGAERNISFSFHDNVFDPGLIARAVELLQDPIRFLA